MRSSGIPTISIAGSDEPMLMFIVEGEDNRHENWVEYIKEADDLPPIKPASEVTPIFYPVE